MSLLSEFRDKLKVKTDDKRTRKYTYENIKIREDKETGKLELYIKETLSSSNIRRAWTTSRYRERETNIRNPKDKIYYTFVVSPSGHFYKREYDDYKQARRYGVMYSVLAMLQQILGVTLEQAYEAQFKKEELIGLIEKINREKEDAIYNFVEKVKYNDSYKGKRTLEGLHIAVGYRRNSEKCFFKCVEDPEIKITIKDNGTLEIVKDGKKENIARKNYSFSTRRLEWVRSERTTRILDGYTFEAVQKIVEDKKEKNKEREDE